MTWLNWLPGDWATRGGVSAVLACMGWVLRRRKRVSPLISTLLAGTVLLRVERLRREAAQARIRALEQEVVLLRSIASSDGRYVLPDTTPPPSKPTLPSCTTN